MFFCRILEEYPEYLEEYLKLKVCEFKKNGVCKLLVLLKIIFRNKIKLFYLLNIGEKEMNLQCDASCKYYVSMNQRIVKSK